MSGPLIRWSMRRRQSLRLTSATSPKHFRRNLLATDRFEAIRELVALACAQSDLNGEHVEAVAWERERLAATGIGNGVALPNARVAGLARPIVVVGMSDAGIDFDAPDGQLAQLVFLLLTPLDNPTAQLDLSANIGELFRHPKALERVLRAGSYTEFLAALKTAAPKASH